MLTSWQRLILRPDQTPVVGGQRTGCPRAVAVGMPGGRGLPVADQESREGRFRTR